MVIGAVLIPGAKAPKLVSNELVARMKPGSVLVDIAVDQGGCFEDTQPTTHADPTYMVHNSVFYCVANMPGAVPNTSTYALTNATLPYTVALADKGWQEACRDDHSLALGLNTHAGRSPTAPVAEAHDMDSRLRSTRSRLSGAAAPVAGVQRAVRTYLDHLSVERGLARQHARVVPPRPAALRRRSWTTSDVTELDGSPRPTVTEFLMRLREGDADHPPLGAATAARAVVAVRGFHRFAVPRRAGGTVDPSAGVRPPAPAKRLPKALPLARRRGDPGGRRAPPAPRWRRATGPCWRCCTAPAPGSPRRSAWTSTTSTSRRARCCFAARAARSGWCRSAPTP